MRDALTEWRLALELSTARLVAVAVTLVGCVLVFAENGSTSFWIGYHQDTGMYLSVFSFAIAGSLFVVAGYYTAVARLAHAPELARATRSPSAVLRLRVTGDLTWLLTGLLLVHAAAYVRTIAASGEVSFMGVSLSTLGLASACLCYALGLLAGLLVRRMLAIFVVGCIPYGLTLYANLSMSLDLNLYRAVRLVAPYIDQGWGPGLVPNDPAILLLAAYCALLAAGLVSLAAHRLRRGSVRVTAVLLAGATAAGLITATQVTASDYYLERQTGYVCTEDQGVCAWARHGTIEPWAQALRASRSAVEGLGATDVRFAEYGVPTDGDYVELQLSTSRVDTHEIADMMLREHVDRLAALCPSDLIRQTKADVHGLLAPALSGEAAATRAAQEILDAC